MHSFTRSFFLTFAIAIFVLSFSAPVLAQDAAFATNMQPAPLMTAGEGVIQPLDVPVAEEPPLDSVPDPGQDATEAGTSIVETVVRFLHKFLVENPVFSILTASIVGILKFIPGIKPNVEGKGGIPSSTLAFIVAGILWLSYTVASMAGYQGQYDSIANRVAEFAPYIMGFLATLFGAQIVHEQSAKRNIAVLGSKRPVTTPAQVMPLVPSEAPTPGLVRTVTPVATVQSEGTTISWIPDVSDEDRSAA